MPDFSIRDSTYTIREFQEQDLPGIVQLYFDVEGDINADAEDYTLAWRWLHQHNPYSIQKVLVGLDTQNKVIAHLAIVPFKFVAGERVCLGAVPTQLVVAEGFRKTLVFPNLESKVLKEYRDLGIDFIYGYVIRPKVLKAHLALGFRKFGDLPVYARPYRISHLARRLIKNEPLNVLIRPILLVFDRLLRLSFCRKPIHLEVTRVEQFDAGMDAFLRDVQTCFRYSALRNSQILNWRFVDSPRDYQIFIVKEKATIAGYMVLRRMKMQEFDVLAIVDLLFPPDRSDVGKALLNTAHQIALKFGVDMTACLLSQRDPFLPVLEKFGYIKTPEVFTLIIHEPKGVASQFDNGLLDGWHLTWFDHDYV